MKCALKDNELTLEEKQLIRISEVRKMNRMINENSITTTKEEIKEMMLSSTSPSGHFHTA